MATTTPPTVMTFSATDPSGGAGMQADLMTISSMGCHPLSVITGSTVQDTIGVDNLIALDADWVNDQARAILEDIPVHAFKLGLLGSVDNVAVIAEILADYPEIPLVVDPILASGRGDALTTEAMQTAMQTLIFPQSTLVTPNSFEAKRLCYGEEAESQDYTLAETAEQLYQAGCEYVMITGTHERTTDVVNTLYGMKDGEFAIIQDYHWPRLEGSYHGSGCTLASAIAACLAHGLPVEEAVKEAQDFTWQTLKNGFRPGMGQYIPDRFYWVKDAVADEEGHAEEG